MGGHATGRRVAVMASGAGSNLAAILAAVEDGTCPVEVCLVLSDRAEAGALRIAREAGVPRVEHLAPAEYADREAFDRACITRIEEAACDWIVLAGYMRILSAPFVRRFAGRILNIHPSLLPAFPGADGVGDALRHGVWITGCTVHLVDEVLDGGPILAQAAVPVRDGDNRESLLQRIHRAEHRLYPQTLARVVQYGFDLQGRCVRWRGG